MVDAADQNGKSKPLCSLTAEYDSLETKDRVIRTGPCEAARPAGHRPWVQNHSPPRKNVGTVVVGGYLNQHHQVCLSLR